MAAGKGVDSYISWKKESTYGTAATGSYLKYPFLTESYLVTKERFFSQAMSGAAARSTIFAGATATEGGASNECGFSNVEYPLYGVMGAQFSNTQDAAFPTYTKVYNLSTTLSPFTNKISKGAIPGTPGTPKVFTFVGNKVTKMEFTFAATGILQYSYETLGKNETSTASTGDAEPTFATAPNTELALLATSDAAVGLITRDIGIGGSTTYCIKAGRITIDRKLKADRFCAGELNPREPEIDDFADVTGEFEIEFEDKAVYDAFIAQSDQDITLTFQGIVTPGGSAIRYSIQFRIPTCRYDSPGGLALVDKPGILTARVPWTAFGNATGAMGTAKPIGISVTNEINGTVYTTGS